jgi:hypothetical protein
MMTCSSRLPMQLIVVMECDVVSSTLWNLHNSEDVHEYGTSFSLSELEDAHVPFLKQMLQCKQRPPFPNQAHLERHILSAVHFPRPSCTILKSHPTASGWQSRLLHKLVR